MSMRIFPLRDFHFSLLERTTWEKKKFIQQRPIATGLPCLEMYRQESIHSPRLEEDWRASYIKARMCGIEELRRSILLTRGHISASLKLIKQDAEYAERKLAGTVFEIYKIMEMVVRIGYSVMTDCGNGEYVVQDLTVGQYCVKEIGRLKITS